MSHRIRAAVLVAIAVLVSCSLTLAQEPPASPPWTYVEAGYLNVDPDAAVDAGNAWFAGGTFGFLKSFHASAQFIDGDYAEDVDLSFWKFGAGWHGALGEKADLVAEATWNDIEIGDTSAGEDDAIGVTGGVRWKVLKFLEIDGFINWVDYEDSQSSYEARAIFDVWRLGLGAGIEFGEDEDRYNAFARFNFGAK